MAGRYTSKGWTEWTQGFQFGMPLLQFDATGDAAFLDLGRARTLERMAPHLTHTGVHDHGFNNVSTYGNLWRLMIGRYHRPREESRIFLFLDMEGSTAAAEKLGAPRFLELLASAVLALTCRPSSICAMSAGTGGSAPPSSASP